MGELRDLETSSRAFVEKMIAKLCTRPWTIQCIEFFIIHDKINDLEGPCKILVRSEISKIPSKICSITGSGEWLYLRVKSEVWKLRPGLLLDNRLPEIVVLEIFRFLEQIADFQSPFTTLVMCEISKIPSNFCSDTRYGE